jgi:hypothetical protein
LPNRKLRRSAHRSVTELEDDIRRWISEWNKNPRPFIWTKSADEAAHRHVPCSSYSQARSLPGRSPSALRRGLGRGSGSRAGVDGGGPEAVHPTQVSHVVVQLELVRVRAQP